MLSIYYLSQSPLSSPKSKPPLSNYKLFRDVTAISHSSKLLAKRSCFAALNKGDDAALGDSPAGPLVSHQRKLSWGLLSPSLEANGVESQEENKKEPPASKEKKNKSIWDSEIDFLRYNSSSDNADVAGELQASIVSYKKRFPWRFFNPNFQVDLVSAVHIADKMYFNTLQERLASYDCVLYEGVGNKDKDFKKEENESGKDYSIIGFIQRFIGRILSMDFQLDCINYKGQNWYNADLDIDTFLRLQEERGENILAMASGKVGSALKSTLDSTTPQFDSIKSKLLTISYIVPMPLALSLIINFTCSPSDNLDENTDENDNFGPNFGEFLELGFGSGFKVTLARALTSRFAMEMNLEVKENSVIIGERNKAALEELKKAINRGERKIAILYGAGHMPDLGKRLMQDFNLVPCDINWLTAWAIKRPKNKYLGPFFEKYGGKYLPFNERNLDLLFVGLSFSGLVLFDLWVWWTAFHWAGFQMLRLVQALIIV